MDEPFCEDCMEDYDLHATHDAGPRARSIRPTQDSSLCEFGLSPSRRSGLARFQ
ncbi:hypothetical protein L484_011739 [Morus notabilis]|uniref:Uncharacterized protein n=1 Tax=Morus notabilis TaxID=981085 RepID=W9RLX3_9ROSA|nr:hypothetical protein L484_011739 [Morus notabilis]